MLAGTWAWRVLWGWGLCEPSQASRPVGPGSCVWPAELGPSLRLPLGAPQMQSCPVSRRVWLLTWGPGRKAGFFTSVYPRSSRTRGTKTPLQMPQPVCSSEGAGATSASASAAERGAQGGSVEVPLGAAALLALHLWPLRRALGPHPKVTVLGLYGIRKGRCTWVTASPLKLLEEVTPTLPGQLGSP